MNFEQRLNVVLTEAEGIVIDQLKHFGKAYGVDIETKTLADGAVHLTFTDHEGNQIEGVFQSIGLWAGPGSMKGQEVVRITRLGKNSQTVAAPLEAKYIFQSMIEMSDQKLSLKLR